MNVRIVFISKNDSLNAFVGKEKTRIIPPEIMKLRYFSERRTVFSVSTFSPKTEAAEADEIFIYLKPIQATCAAILVLVDINSGFDSSIIENTIFTRAFHVERDCQSLLNIFRMSTSKLLREFSVLSSLFDDLKFRKLFLLPLRNFHASEIATLCRLANDGSSRFADDIQGVLANLRMRQRPKKQRKFPTTYLVDDRKLHFEYGHEVHARMETKIPPHNEKCLLNGDFRFGRKYDPSRHFNVSEAEGLLDAHQFLNCHSEGVTLGGKTHANIFPNDFL